MNLDVAIDSEVINIDDSVTKFLGKDAFKYKVSETFEFEYFRNIHGGLSLDTGPKYQCARRQCYDVLASSGRRPVVIDYSHDRQR